MSMNSDGCAGRVAVVTGAAGGGMGRSTALTLAREGAKVVVNYRGSRKKAEAVAAHIIARGGEAMAMQADVFDAEDCRRLVDATNERFGRVDICFIGPGGDWRMGPVAATNCAETAEDVRREVAPVANLLPLLLPGMCERQWGRIIAMSWAAESPYWSHAYSYAVGKAARNAAVLTACREAWKHHVTVNLMGPGPVGPIDSLERAVELCDHGPAWQNRVVVSPQDIAEGVAFLCSDAGRFVTGGLMPYKEK